MIKLLKWSTLIYLFLSACPLIIVAQQQVISLHIDGKTKFQTMDGFGVNINSAWWYNGKYEDPEVVRPAIDLLADSLGATIFRVIIEEIDWEEINDNDDPDHFNWEYYNNVFSGDRFQGMWETLRYLNQKGITDGLIISFMGAPPGSGPLKEPDPARSWMGGTDNTIAIDKESELAESVAAILFYMRHNAKIQFSLVSPLNETDIQSQSKSAGHPDGIVEGPNIPDAVQYTRIIKMLAEKLDAIGMEDIRFVLPDAGGSRLFNDCLDEMLRDPCLMNKIASWGVHVYGNNAAHYRRMISRSDNSVRSMWVTETAGIRNLLGQLDDAEAVIYWDGFDCVYQHARRNGYGDIPPNDWVFSFGDEGKPLIEFLPSTKSWIPRKQFYEFAQIMNFVRPGSVRISLTGQDSTLSAFAYSNPDKKIVITGRNNGLHPVVVNASISHLPEMKSMKLIYTSSNKNFSEEEVSVLNGDSFNVTIPAESVFTLTGSPFLPPWTMNPEPPDWYSGDIHIHRNCGEVTPVLSESEFTVMMEPNNLAVISVLADMGNGEVQNHKTDLPKVTGKDAPQSRPGRIVHWDAEWHFDPAGVTFENMALGGHIVLLGLNEAYTIWDESVYKILEWGREQNAVTGLCHMQYLGDSIPSELTCCTPIDFPVETAFGTIDFLAEDVWLNDKAILAYYRLLNCGFRLGWAAGTDYPCNNSEPFGSLLTYVQVKDQPLTYNKWIEGIKNGRTVVSTNGHLEFLDMKVNGDKTPGDEIKFRKKGKLEVTVKWTSVIEQSGSIELICNGKVVASSKKSAKPGEPAVLKARIPISESSWICARRMDEKGHRSHTSPVYITVGDAPVRASAEDALYFVKWIDKILVNIAPDGPWNHFFTQDLPGVQNRYLKAKEIYEKIALEARNKK